MSDSKNKYKAVEIDEFYGLDDASNRQATVVQAVRRSWS